MDKALDWNYLFEITEEQIRKASPDIDWYIESIDGKYGNDFKLFKNNWIQIELRINSFSTLKITLNISADIDAISKGARFTYGQCVIKGTWEHAFWDLTEDAEPSFLDIDLLDISDYNFYPGMNFDKKDDERYVKKVFGIPFCDHTINLENSTLTQDWKSKDEINFDVIRDWSLSRDNLPKSLPPTDWIEEVTITRWKSYPTVIPDGMDEILSSDYENELLISFKPND